MVAVGLAPVLVLANALPIDPRVMLVFACFCLLLSCCVLGGGAVGGASFVLSDDVHYRTILEVGVLLVVFLVLPH